MAGRIRPGRIPPATGNYSPTTSGRGSANCVSARTCRLCGYLLTGQVAATPASMILSWLTDNRPPRTRTSGRTRGAPTGAPLAPHYVAVWCGGAVTRPRAAGRLQPTGSVQGGLLPEVANSGGWLAHPGDHRHPGLPCGCDRQRWGGPVPDSHGHLHHGLVQRTVPFKKTDVWHSIATVPGLQPELPLVINNVETAGAALSPGCANRSSPRPTAFPAVVAGSGRRVPPCRIEPHL